MPPPRPSRASCLKSLSHVQLVPLAAHGQDQRGTSLSFPSFSTDSSFKKLAALRAEADAAVERAEAAEAKNKDLEQQLLGKDQDITSLNHKLEVLDGSLHGSEEKLAETKTALEEAERGKATNDSLTRKIELLEDELDTAEKNLKETVEKCVPSPCLPCHASSTCQTPTGRYQSGAFRTSSAAC